MVSSSPPSRRNVSLSLQPRGQPLALTLTLKSPERFVLFDAASLAAHRRALEAATGT